MEPSSRRAARVAPIAFGALAGVILVAAVVLASRDLEAKTTFDSAYTVEQTFNAALRLVRIDHGFKVSERDPEAGYVLFDYRSAESGDRVTPGSIEIVRAAANTRVVIQLSSMPRYHEDVMMNELVRKLRSEYGEPVRAAGTGRSDAGITDPGD